MTSYLFSKIDFNEIRNTFTEMVYPRPCDRTTCFLTFGYVNRLLLQVDLFYFFADSYIGYFAYSLSGDFKKEPVQSFN